MDSSNVDRLRREYPETYATLRLLLAINEGRKERGDLPLPLGPLPWERPR